MWVILPNLEKMFHQHLGCPPPPSYGLALLLLWPVDVLLCRGRWCGSTRKRWLSRLAVLLCDPTAAGKLSPINLGPGGRISKCLFPIFFVRKQETRTGKRDGSRRFPSILSEHVPTRRGHSWTLLFSPPIFLSFFCPRRRIDFFFLLSRTRTQILFSTYFFFIGGGGGDGDGGGVGPIESRAFVCAIQRRGFLSAFLPLSLSTVRSGSPTRAYTQLPLDDM